MVDLSFPDIPTPQLSWLDFPEPSYPIPESIDGTKGLDPVTIEKLTMGEFKQDYHGQDAQAYVEQHFNKQETKHQRDPSQFITPLRTKLHPQEEADLPECYMIYPRPIRPHLLSSPDIHNIISRMVELGREQTPSIQLPNPSPLTITIPKSILQPSTVNYPSNDSTNVHSQSFPVEPLIITIPMPQSTTPITISYPNLQPKKSITIKLPQKFSYESNHQVPWNYDPEVVVSTGDKIEPEVAEVGGMTRSGRFYTSEEIELRRKKGKEKVSEVPVSGEVIKKAVTEEKIAEFLKVLKKSEYSVVEQLNRMPAQISILGLLMASEVHRSALIKILNEAHVPTDITPDTFQHMVGQVLASNVITFTDDDSGRYRTQQGPPHSSDVQRDDSSTSSN